MATVCGSRLPRYSETIHIDHHVRHTHHRTVPKPLSALYLPPHPRNPSDRRQVHRQRTDLGPAQLTADTIYSRSAIRQQICSQGAWGEGEGVLGGR